MNCCITPENPSERKKTVIVSGENKIFVEALKKEGITTLLCERNPSLPPPIASHADVNCLYLGENTIAVLAEQASLIYSLKSLEDDVIEVTGAKNEYPADCILNCLLMGKTAASHKTALNAQIRELLFSKGFSLIASNQGYSRCSVCPIGDKAAITADDGLARTLQEQGIDVLIIPKGEIKLSGYEYGFIGGSSFMTDDKELAFFGKASEISYFGLIKEFLKKHEVLSKEITDEPLTDIGGAIRL